MPGKPRVWGQPKPHYRGWYCALRKLFIRMQHDHAKEGGTLEPLSEKKEIVYVHDDGRVFSLVFASRGRGRKWRSEPEFSESRLSEWVAFEPVQVGVGWLIEEKKKGKRHA